jgi:hypothetical protein
MAFFYRPAAFRATHHRTPVTLKRCGRGNGAAGVRIGLDFQGRRLVWRIPGASL